MGQPMCEAPPGPDSLVLSMVGDAGFMLAGLEGALVTGGRLRCTEKRHQQQQQQQETLDCGEGCQQWC